MTATSETQPPEGPEEARDTAGSGRRTAILSALILIVAAGLAALTFLTEPTAARGGATKETAMLVEVTRAERGTWRPELVAVGAVEPSQDVTLRPQVAGRIVGRGPGFTPGGFVAEGETLLQIERADFEHVVAERRSDLRQALADLAIEAGRRDVAEDEYAFLDEPLPSDKEALVLREPQLDAARGRVAAARAAVAQARLDLARTTIEAPFAAHILTREVNVGSQVSPEDALGRLVGLDTWWVVIDLPLAKLRWVTLPGADGEEGSVVRVRSRASWPEGVHREGRLFRLVGALDDRTRMARVLATIPDPLSRRADAPDDEPPLMIGEFVEARIQGVEIEDVVRLDRDHLRDGDTVWVMAEDGRLSVREVEVAVRDAEHAFVSAGLDDGERVVTSNLSTVVDGARLRLEAQGAPAEAPGE